MEIFHRFKELSFILSDIEANALCEFVENYEALIKNKIPQDEDKTSKAPLINEELYLNFFEQDAKIFVEIIRLFLVLKLNLLLNLC